MVDYNTDEFCEEEYSRMKKSLPITNHPCSLPESSIKELKRSKTEITYIYRPEFVPRPRYGLFF